MKPERPPRRKWTGDFFNYMFRASRDSPIFYHLTTFIGDFDESEIVRPHVMAGFHGVMFQEHDGKEWRDVRD